MRYAKPRYAQHITAKNPRMKARRQDTEQIRKAASARWRNWARYLIAAAIGALAASGYLAVPGGGHHADAAPTRTDSYGPIMEHGNGPRSQAPPEKEMQPIEQEKGR